MCLRVYMKNTIQLLIFISQFLFLNDGFCLVWQIFIFKHSLGDEKKRKFVRRNKNMKSSVCTLRSQER